MASDDARSEERPARRGGLGSLLIRMGQRLGGEVEEAPREPGPDGGAEPAVDIVDQAEAFQTVRVSDVMTPRADIVAIELSTPFDEVVRTFAEAEHSRMPIYRETLDEPIGLVNIKDVFKLLQPRAPGEAQGQGKAVREPALRRLRREVLYVPASMRAADLLIRMQATRIHMALVIDEFGGTDGLVTMEDLIEAVVGDIDDEYDETTAQILRRAGGALEAAGRAPLEDLEELLGTPLTPEDLQEEEIETVAGLVSALAGRLPQRGEVITHPAGFEFEVMEADPRRIKRVRVRRPAAPLDGQGPDGAAASATPATGPRTAQA